MLKVGDHIQCVTKTKNDVFGTVLYRVDEVGLKCPEKNCEENDGVKCVMLGGSGPSAHAGRVIYDCTKRIEKDIAEKRTKKVPRPQAEQVAAQYKDRPKGVLPGGIREFGA
jgi:hypothetical protein